MNAGRENGRGRGLDLTIWGISDTELLAIVDDLADENGWTTNLDVRMQLGEHIEEVKHSGVGSRMAWMRRFGWLERNDAGQHRLTAMGHAMLDNPRLTKAIESALSNLNPAQRLALTKEIAESGVRSPDEVRVALRRQWLRSSGVRR
jgi:hypothetical protein